MKNKITILLALSLFAISSVFAQAPQAFKYQAIARDNSGNILMNQNVSFRISIVQGSSLGAIVYTETQSATTNQFGLANLNIGTGTVITGTFSAIGWNTNNYWMKTEMDPAGGTSFTNMGTAQLLSVPYSLSALTAGQLTTPGVTTGNVLTWNGSSWISQATPLSYTAGTGINIAGNTISNTAPNQTVTVTAGSGISVTGTYPNFTVTNTEVTPAGSIMAYGGTTAPAGWLLCDGTPYGTTVYPTLFAAIGTNFGGSVGTFYVPDLRGTFLRGRDGTANNDPDHTSRTAMNIGGNTGNSVGSIQSDTLESHSHTRNASGVGESVQEIVGNSSSWQGQAGGGATLVGPLTITGSTGGNETRPKNAYVNYIIKY